MAALGGLAIMGLALWLRRTLRRRRWAFFWACITLGILYAVLIGWKWAVWEAAGGLDLPRHWGCWSGLVPLAFCWGIGLFLLFRIPREGV